MAKLLSYCCNSPAAINYHLVGDRHFCQKCREPCNIYEVEDTVTFGSEKVEQSWEKEFYEEFQVFSRDNAYENRIIINSVYLDAVKSFFARVIEVEKEKVVREQIKKDAYISGKGWTQFNTSDALTLPYDCSAIAGRIRSQLTPDTESSTPNNHAHHTT